MKRYKYTLFLLFFILLPLVSSCSKEEVMPIKELEQGLTFHIEISKQPTVRAATEDGTDDENQIKNFWVFISGGTDDADFLIAQKCAVNDNDISQYFIPVPADKKNQLKGAKATYFVANYDFDPDHLPKNINELKGKIMNDSFDNIHSKGIVMVGYQIFTYNYPDTKDLGTINLERRIVKLRIFKPEFKVEGYEVVASEPAQMKLTNRPTESYLYKLSNTSKPFDKDKDFKSITDNKCEFYSYFQDWTQNSSLAPSVSVKLKIKNKSTGEEFWNHYLVPIVPTADKKLVPNYIYEVNVHLNRLGAREENEAVVIENSHVVIKPWNYISTDADIANAKFLYFFEHGHSGEFDLTSREAHLKFATSSEITDCQIICNYVHINPDLDKVSVEKFPIQLSDSDYPQNIDYSNGEVYFEVNDIKGCYKKEIIITIANKQGLTDQLTLTQVPNTLIQEWTSVDQKGLVREIKTKKMPIEYIDVKFVNYKKEEKTIKFPIYLGYPKTITTMVYNSGKPKEPKEKDRIITNFNDETSHMLSPSFYLQTQNDNALLMGRDNQRFIEMGLVNEEKDVIKRGPAYVMPFDHNYLYLYYEGETSKTYAIWRGINYPTIGPHRGEETIKVKRGDTYNKNNQRAIKNWRLPTIAELLYLHYIQSKTAYGKVVRYDEKYWAANGKMVEFKNNTVSIIDMRKPFEKSKYHNEIADNAYQYDMNDLDNWAKTLYVADYREYNDEWDDIHQK